MPAERLRAWHTPLVSTDGAREAESAAGPDERGSTPAEAIGQARVRAPTRGNRRLETLLDAVNADAQLRAWWHMAQVTSERLGMSDHSWVHVQIVLNIGLRLLRLLVKAGVEPAMVADHGMGRRDAEIVVASGALLHDVGMSIHRADHEEYSLFLAQSVLQSADGLFDAFQVGIDLQGGAKRLQRGLGLLQLHVTLGHPGLSAEMKRVQLHDALTAAGFERIEIRETHRVHEQAGSAIVRARKPACDRR